VKLTTLSSSQVINAEGIPVLQKDEFAFLFEKQFDRRVHTQF